MAMRMSSTSSLAAASHLMSRSWYHHSNGKSQAFLLLGLSSCTTTTMTLCESNNNGLWESIVKTGKDGSVDWAGTLDQAATQVGGTVQGAIETGMPTQLSYGFISGYCSGYALKKVGKAGAVVFGLGFMTLQTLSYTGYIQVDHVQMRKDLSNFMDLNEDGKIDHEDTKKAYAKLLSVLEFNLPAGAGFGGGFIAGLRSG